MTLILLDPFRIPAASGPVYDPDAQAMFDARAAVGDPVPAAYALAISNYVVALKAISGFWGNIIQLVVIAGATTVAGARIAIKGNNLTNNNFVNGDIALKTGSKGNGTSKYWGTGYSGNPSGTGQNNFHMYMYVTEVSTASAVRTLFGNGGNTGSGRRVITHQLANPGDTFWRINGSGSFSASGRVTGAHGIARGSSSSFTSLVGTTSATHTDTSVATSNGSYLLLARGPESGSTPVDSSYANARFLIWALGANVGLTNYNTPTANLITALNAI